jgi:hypothetical protein
MTKTRFGRSASARAARGSARANLKISGAIQLPYKSVFVITFRKIVPMTQEWSTAVERRVSRFSTICAKTLVLKLKIDKVTVILTVLNLVHVAAPPVRCSVLYTF